MALLYVTTISSKRASLEADLQASVESLQKCVRSSLGFGNQPLPNSFESLVDGDATLDTPGLQKGDCITPHAGIV